MADESRHTDTSFLDEKSGPKLHVKDVLFIILRNLHWLVLCGAVGAFIAGYWVRHQNRVYESSARVLIKGSSTGSSNNAMREASVKTMFANKALYNSDINNEMMIFTSKSAITEVAQTLKLNITYTAKTRIVNRVKDLYGEMPFTIDFIDNSEDDYVSFDATPLDAEQLRIDMEGYEPMTLKYNDTVAAPFGRIVAHSTWFLTPSYYDVPIHVTHNSIDATIDHYRAALQVYRDDDFNTIVNIRLNDSSPIRATEVINEAIRVYNEDAVKDKKRIIAYTYDYINERQLQAREQAARPVVLRRILSGHQHQEFGGN